MFLVSAGAYKYAAKIGIFTLKYNFFTIKSFCFTLFKSFRDYNLTPKAVLINQSFR